MLTTIENDTNIKGLVIPNPEELEGQPFNPWEEFSEEDWGYFLWQVKNIPAKIQGLGPVNDKDFFYSIRNLALIAPKQTAELMTDGFWKSIDFEKLKRHLSPDAILQAVLTTNLIADQRGENSLFSLDEYGINWEHWFEDLDPYEQFKNKAIARLIDPSLADRLQISTMAAQGFSAAIVNLRLFEKWIDFASWSSYLKIVDTGLWKREFQPDATAWQGMRKLLREVREEDSFYLIFINLVRAMTILAAQEIRISDGKVEFVMPDQIFQQKQLKVPQTLKF